MSRFQEPSYHIEQPEPSDLFLRARRIAGEQLQRQFVKHRGSTDEHRDFKWLKMELTYPSFDHFTFAYKNQVFSVVIDLIDSGRPHLPDTVRERLIDAATKYDLVPCIYEISLPSLEPMEPGWNLRHVSTGKRVDPVDIATDEDTLMSEWELHNFAIQVVRGYIVSTMKGSILSYCDIMQVDPQVWFAHAEGTRNWVLVRHFLKPESAERTDWVGLEKANPQLKSFDGYFAAVSFASAAPVLHDLDGKLIPLSGRFSDNVALYRGDQFYVKFDGLKRIHVS